LRNYQKKRRFAAANRRLPVDFKALIGRRSKLAIMNANNDSLSVRSVSVSGSGAEGRPYEVHQSAKPAFFIRPHLNCGHYSFGVSRGNGGSVDKITLCCKRATAKPRHVSTGRRVLERLIRDAFAVRERAQAPAQRSSHFSPVADPGRGNICKRCMV
jgi:hypothetical protein